MNKFYNFGLFVLLLIAFMPAAVFAQAATIVSEREPIVVYSENDLNPKQQATSGPARRSCKTFV